MNAEIGIDEEGRAYIRLEPSTNTEWDMMRFMRSFLPLRFDVSDEGNDDVRIVGDRLPGSGKGG